MDYVEVFQNLRTNNKWGRKSPHKAVLMLTVIELFEKNMLQDNEIYYDDTLKATFLQVWERVLPNEPISHPDAYLPFWYLQSDSFWHIVPKRGKEDILSLMRDNNVKPSEAKLYDSVRCAELDNDLYFLMTIPSGRSSLKRALLETYTDLPDWQIDKMAESEDNTVDHSIAALSEYESILLKASDEKKGETVETDKEIMRQFQCLDEDLQISLNLEYFSFLKSHRSDREMFREICPTVCDLYDHIVNHSVKQEDIAPSFVFTYENFLSDLKIALMSEDGAMELIDKIEKSIDTLRGNYQQGNENESTVNEPIEFEDETDNDDDFEEQEEADVHIHSTIHEEFIATENRKGKPWTDNEEELIKLFFKQGKDVATIAETVGRTEVSIKMRLAKLGLIEYTYGEEEDYPATKQQSTQINIDLNDFTIENSFVRCSIRNKRGDRVFSEEGKLKRIGEKLYRLNLKSECFTIKDMRHNGAVWMKGEKKIVAYPYSALYGIINRIIKYEDIIEDIVDCQAFPDCKVKVSGIWYDNNGEIISVERQAITPPQASFNYAFTFVPKGKMKSIGEVAEESYDILLTMAVIEFMQFTPQPTIITFDRLACMMIAIAWEILNENEDVKVKESELNDCIIYLMDESKEEMNELLTWSSSRKTVFNAIKDYPMAGVFEDMVDMMIENAPYNVLKAWIKEDNKDKIVRCSNTPSSTCLYGIHPMKRDPYIEVKQGWKRYLNKEFDGLMNYYKKLYLDYLEE